MGLSQSDLKCYTAHPIQGNDTENTPGWASEWEGATCGPPGTGLSRHWISIGSLSSMALPGWDSSCLSPAPALRVRNSSALPQVMAVAEDWPGQRPVAMGLCTQRHTHHPQGQATLYTQQEVLQIPGCNSQS